MSLTKTLQIAGLAGVTAVISAVVGRMAGIIMVIMGTVLDTLRPRVGNAVVMFMFAPPVFLISMITDGGGFEAIRLFIGISLCGFYGFVCCQFWVGSMFN
ncbi:hypothetical protein CEUSTIGMA_g3208.t1 [Chlamydomonas eustigma]|uniref:Major facilitator superfamily (MFS) profile domain-containing protein n=1 Tax=Chlamydomonas eustigma TaxID=1157962 RepID=A0A250WYA4_9CHLO|nr:hypothetical protein CEUSTIGMA_g3208.t1 [Chlamydomonas eustigma]|eukprot:GAX75765.1 hypothetical protein CEUSTIGMA_g3208.t1 [Chlamydomonas eustigma]